MEFLIGKQLFHLVVNPGTSRRPTVDLELVQTTRNVNGTLFLGIFQWDEPTKRVPFTAEPKIPEILTKWKAPLVLESKALYENMSLLNERRYNSAKFRKFADVCMIQTSDL